MEKPEIPAGDILQPLQPEKEEVLKELEIDEEVIDLRGDDPEIDEEPEIKPGEKPINDSKDRFKDRVSSPLKNLNPERMLTAFDTLVGGAGAMLLNNLICKGADIKESQITLSVQEKKDGAVIVKEWFDSINFHGTTPLQDMLLFFGYTYGLNISMVAGDWHIKKRAAKKANKNAAAQTPIEKEIQRNGGEYIPFEEKNLETTAIKFLKDKDGNIRKDKDGNPMIDKRGAPPKGRAK